MRPLFSHHQRKVSFWHTSDGPIAIGRVGSLAFSGLAADELAPPSLSSRPEEFHLRALPEPCMTLSSHTAPDVRPLLERLCLVHRLLLFPVGPWPRPNNAAPSLQPHYRAFDATTGGSAPAPRFGTLALTVGAACGLSLHVVDVTKHRFSRSIRKPGRASRRLHAGCRSGSLRASPELIPVEGSPPVLTSPNPLSTLLQR